MATLCQTEHPPAQSPVKAQECLTAKSHTPRLPPSILWARKYLWLRNHSAGARIFGFKYSQKYAQRNLAKQFASRKSLCYFVGKNCAVEFIYCVKKGHLLFRDLKMFLSPVCSYMRVWRESQAFLRHSTMSVSTLPPIARGYLMSKLEDKLWADWLLILMKL